MISVIFCLRKVECSRQQDSSRSTSIATLGVQLLISEKGTDIRKRNSCKARTALLVVRLLVGLLMVVTEVRSVFR